MPIVFTITSSAQHGVAVLLGPRGVAPIRERSLVVLCDADHGTKGVQMNLGRFSPGASI